MFDLNEEKRIPLIISLIKEIRGIITGAANECVFSTARDVFSYRRMRIGPRKAEMIIFLKRNFFSFKKYYWPRSWLASQFNIKIFIYLNKKYNIKQKFMKKWQEQLYRTTRGLLLTAILDWNLWLCRRRYFYFWYTKEPSYRFRILTNSLRGFCLKILSYAIFWGQNDFNPKK